MASMKRVRLAKKKTQDRMDAETQHEDRVDRANQNDGLDCLRMCSSSVPVGMEPYFF